MGEERNAAQASGDVLITSPIDYATNGQTLRVQVAGEAPPPAKNNKKGKGKPSVK